MIVLGTDTDAGKTTFSLLFLARHADRYAYWKPVETGESDTEKVRRLLPQVQIHAPLARFSAPVAPPLAAQLEGRAIPDSAAIREGMPTGPLLLETFGSPFSPLTTTQLQIEYIQASHLPTILVSSSALGAIGRTLQTLRALAMHGLSPEAVVLMGPLDAFAESQIANHWQGGKIFGLQPPQAWDETGIRLAAEQQATILDALAKPIPTPISVMTSLAKRDHEVIWHPYTSLQDPDLPLEVVGMEGSYLQLSDGRKIIDGISSWWTIQHGHRHPPLMTALQEAGQKYDHVIFAGVTHPPAVEFAELLLQTMPWPGGRVFYSDNGSTAVEVALKLAYQFWCHRHEPQRTLFIGFENGYHGDTFGAMAVGRDPLFFGCFEPLLFHAEQFSVSATILDERLKQIGHQVAAVILEPLVQGAGGMRMHTPEELRAIFEVTRRHGVLFIADEVMTGGGRTGTRWAFQQAGIVPDLVCAAKTLAGGVLPLAVTMASPGIVSAFDTADRQQTFFHGHSFTANPLACAVALANERLLSSGEWQTQAKNMEAFWQKALLHLQDHPSVAAVRIRGSIAAVEIRSEGGYLANIGRAMRQTCLEAGVLLRPLGNVLYAMPPLQSDEETLNRIAAAIRKCVDQLG